VLEHIQNLDHVFSEAARVLLPDGKFFVDELHPFRQYEGTKARFSRADETIQVEAFVHHISDFLEAAADNHLSLVSLNEYWHATDENRPPRILSLYFERH
jgi:malonyl-CoA O-methyltransferase